MSFAGHASALGGPLNAAIDWLHLVAAAAWLGGLPAVYVLAARVRKVGGPVRSVAAEMLRRHGRLALVAAPLVVLTGLANSPLVLGTSRELVASSYGNLLLVKALLASLALAIGAANHLLLRGRGRGHLATLVGAELLIAAVAVMAGATMVTIQPSAAQQPVLTGPSVHPAHFFGEAGPSSVHASVSVPAPGRQSYQVTIRDLADGAPRPDVQKVFLAFTPPAESGLPGERVELEPGEIDGLYAITGAYTPVVGEWGLAVTVRRSGALDESVAFAMGVSESSPAVVGPPPDTGIGVPAPLAMLWQVLPQGLAGWIPGLLAIAAFVLVGVRVRPLVPLRGLLLVLAAVSVLGVGSRTVVEAANRPDAVRPGCLRGRRRPGSAEDGRLIYLANCASCHGTDGAGDGPTATVPRPRPLQESMAGMSDAEVSYRIANGLAGTPMPAFAASLTEQERRDLVSYLRHSPGWRIESDALNAPRDRRDDRARSRDHARAALAHAGLLSSSPAADDTLTVPPEAVTLVFDGELTPDGTGFTVTDADGDVVGEGALDLTVAERNEIRGDLEPGEPGTYTVTWTAVSADGHEERGDFTFTPSRRRITQHRRHAADRHPLTRSARSPSLSRPRSACGARGGRRRDPGCPARRTARGRSTGCLHRRRCRLCRSADADRADSERG